MYFFCPKCIQWEKFPHLQENIEKKASEKNLPVDQYPLHLGLDTWYSPNRLLNSGRTETSKLGPDCQSCTCDWPSGCHWRSAPGTESCWWRTPHLGLHSNKISLWRAATAKYKIVYILVENHRSKDARQSPIYLQLDLHFLLRFLTRLMEFLDCVKHSLKSNLFELFRFVPQFAKIWISRCSWAHLWPAVSWSQLPCSVAIFSVNRNV